jgi:trimethylamine:corrinoid methyltransferase-like protein
MPSETPALEPIKSHYRMNFLSEQQLDDFQEATLQVLEETGVQFPSQEALDVFNAHGAQVDPATQVVKIPCSLRPAAGGRCLLLHHGWLWL